MQTRREKLKAILRKPATRKWVADKIGGGIIGAIAVGVIDFIIDGEADVILDIIGLF